MKAKQWKKLTAIVLSAAMLVQTPLMAEAEDEGQSTIVDDAVVTTSGELFKIQYEPASHWTAETGYPDLFYEGTDYYSVSGEEGTDDYYTMKFIGTGIDLYASKNTAHANCDVYIDDVKEGEALANPTAGSTQHQQLLFSKKDLKDGTHTLKVVKQSSTASLALQLDYIKVYHGELTAQSINLSKSEITLEKGMSEQVTAEFSPWNVTGSKVVWSSEDETVASVDQNGTITAVSSKTAQTTVTASVEGSDVSAQVKVNVIPQVSALSAFVGSVDLLETQDDYSSLMTNFTKSWSDTAWKGDKLISKVGVVSRGETVKNVSVEASDFKTDTGAVIDASNVEIKWLKETLANIGRGNANAPVKAFPDIIYKGGKIDIEPQTVRFAWITIQVPKDAKAGTYKGTVTVSADSLAEPYVLDYEFEVLNLVQPEDPSEYTQVQLWQHPFSVANYYGLEESEWFTEKHFKYMRGSMKEYLEAGGRDVVANIVEEAWNHQSFYSDPSMVKWTKKTDGSFSFDYTWYDAWINFQIECGVLDPENGIGQIKCYSIVPWNNQIAYYDAAASKEVKQTYSPGSEGWISIWTEFLTDFMKHSEEKGWFDITYISMDERSLTDLEPSVELIESLKTEDGRSLKISSALNYSAPEYYDFTDHIQDISINLGSASNQEAMLALNAHRSEKGLTTTVYTCTGNYPSNFTISDPAENMWLMWYSMTIGMDGYMRWAWDNWVETPLTDVTYKYWEPGDGWYIYPVEKDSDDNPEYVYSTPRFELMKKGVRDITKAKYLTEKSQEMGAKVDELVKSMQRPAAGSNGYGSATYANETARQLTISEANRMREGVLTLSKEYVAATAPSREELDAAIAEAGTLKEADYTAETWKALAEALDAAAKLGDDAVQEDLDKAAQTILEAIEKLEKKPDDPVEKPLPYSDVQKGDWYYKYVEDVYKKGLITGLDATTFGPAQTLVRGQFATILYRMEKKPKVSYSARFGDVPDGAFYTKPVLWAAAESVRVVTGYSNGNFGPNDQITREQMAVMMYRYAKYKNRDTSEKADLSKFPDEGEVSGYAKEAMQWCVAKGIISGQGEGVKMLNPQGNTSRAECATIISRYTDVYK